MEVSFKNKSLLNRMGQRGVQSSGFGWGQVAGCCEHGDELSGYIKWSPQEGMWCVQFAAPFVGV
jgi:hypothetical protein